MTPGETPYLFVYGTLRTDAQGSLGVRERARLGREAVSLGVAHAAGSLYDLGDYPGLHETAAPGVRVEGELLKLLQPAATFAWLDAYEGVGPRFPKPEYARVVRDAMLVSTDRNLRAWTYLLIRRPVSSRRIATGVWPPADRP